MNRSLFLKTVFVAVCMITQMQVHAQHSMAWVKGIGDIGTDVAYSITTDSAGNVYTTGGFNGTVDFDPGPGIVTLTANGTNSDVFITKMDAAGNLIWARSCGGTTALAEAGYGIAVDAAGNVYITGLFAGKVDFNPSPAVADTFYRTGNTTLTAFALKLNSAGNFVWAQTGWGAGNGVASSNGIAVDANGDIYIVGAPTPGTPSYITKLNITGAVVWLKTLPVPAGVGTPGIGKSVAISKSGYVYLTTANSTVAAIGTSVGGIVYKMDTAGNIIWSKKPVDSMDPLDPLDDIVSYSVKSIVLDTLDNIYIAGTTGKLNPVNSNGILVCKMDSAGNIEWLRNLGNTMNGINEGGAGIALDNRSNVYVTGSFKDTVDFDPDSTNVFELTANQRTSFILKLNQQGNFVWAVSNNGQNTGTGMGYGIAVDNKNVDNRNRALYTAGYFTDSTFFTSAVDTISLNSTLNGSTRSQDIFIDKLQLCSVETDLSPVACQSYTYNGNTYTTSGTHFYVFESMKGCDSVVNVNLTIGNYATDTTLTIAACQNYTLNGQSYTATGIYKQTHLRVGFVGCDSVITLDLTIKTPPVATATKNGGTLTAGTADTYQWIACDNNKTPVTGATQKDFTPEKNGNYAVVVVSNGCSDTSDCIAVNVGIDDITNEHSIQLYPNPTNGIVVIRSEVALHNAAVRVMNIVGQSLMEDNISGKVCMVDLSPYPAGIYLLEIKEGDRLSNIKLVKE